MTSRLSFLVVCMACALPSCGAEPEEVPLDVPSTLPSAVVRLTPDELNRSASALLGLPVAPWRFAPELTVDGFGGRFATQAPSDVLAEELRAFAVHASTYVPEADRFACADDAVCLTAAVLSFADEAWRRPLDSDARARLVALFDDLVGATSPTLAARLTVQAVLQSPRFLYRIELGTPAEGATVPLDAWELAARLSYFLHDAPPDAALRAAAADGSLLDPLTLELQARRLLDAPAARSAVVAFHREWLEVTRIDDYAPARDVYLPSLSDDDLYARIVGNTRRVMKGEVDQFVEYTLFDAPGGGTFGALLTSTTAWVGEQTAAGYGVDPAADALPLPQVTVDGIDDDRFDLTPVALPADQRAGVLTLAGPLAARAHAVHPAPVHRGLLVLDRVLCDRPNNPPPGAEAQAPPDALGAESTNRERLAAATASLDCIGCHADMNAYGFAFEAYDATGAWREDDFGLPLDTSGAVGETAFGDAVDLLHALADDDRALACYADRWLTHALGRSLADSDGSDDLTARFLLDGGSVRALLLDIVDSAAFRTRSAP